MNIKNFKINKYESGVEIKCPGKKLIHMGLNMK